MPACNILFCGECIYKRTLEVLNIGCVRLASLVLSRSAPRYVRRALTSFQGLTWVSPKCPACGVGHFGAAPRCMTPPREGKCDRSISSCQGLTQVSTTSQGQHREANRTHPLTPKMAPLRLLGRWCNDSFHFTYSGCEGNFFQKSKFNHCTSQEPNEEKTCKGSLSFRCGRKTPDNYSREKPTQSGRDWQPNPHCAPGVIQTGVLEVEGEERYHYANLTTLFYYRAGQFLYTVGQKAKISGMKEKWYIVDKNPLSNEVIVVRFLSLFNVYNGNSLKFM